MRCVTRRQVGPWRRRASISWWPTCPMAHSTRASTSARSSHAFTHAYAYACALYMPCTPCTPCALCTTRAPAPFAPLRALCRRAAARAQSRRAAWWPLPTRGQCRARRCGRRLHRSFVKARRPGSGSAGHQWLEAPSRLRPLGFRVELEVEWPPQRSPGAPSETLPNRAVSPAFIVQAPRPLRGSRTRARGAAWSNVAERPRRGSARARPPRRLRRHLAAPGGSVLPGADAGPLGAQPLPRVCERAASKVVDSTVCLHQVALRGREHALGGPAC